jgi:hypothetical protein
MGWKNFSSRRGDLVDLVEMMDVVDLVDHTRIWLLERYGLQYANERLRKNH